MKLIYSFCIAVFLMCISMISVAQTYGTWSAESGSTSIITGFPSTQVTCTSTTNWPTVAANHGHPNYLGLPYGDACIKTQPITMRYFYKHSSIGTGLQRRCFLTYHKQQCL